MSTEHLIFAAMSVWLVAALVYAVALAFAPRERRMASRGVCIIVADEFLTAVAHSMRALQAVRRQPTEPTRAGEAAQAMARGLRDLLAPDVPKDLAKPDLEVSDEELLSLAVLTFQFIFNNTVARANAVNEVPANNTKGRDHYFWILLAKLFKITLKRI